MMQINPVAPGLERFVDAQDRVYDAFLDKLALGVKTNLWMSFV